MINDQYLVGHGFASATALFDASPNLSGQDRHLGGDRLLASFPTIGEPKFGERHIGPPERPGDLFARPDLMHGFGAFPESAPRRADGDTRKFVAATLKDGTSRITTFDENGVAASVEGRGRDAQGRDFTHTASYKDGKIDSETLTRLDEKERVASEYQRDYSSQMRESVTEYKDGKKVSSQSIFFNKSDDSWNYSSQEYGPDGQMLKGKSVSVRTGASVTTTYGEGGREISTSTHTRTANGESIKTTLYGDAERGTATFEEEFDKRGKYSSTFRQQQPDGSELTIHDGPTVSYTLYQKGTEKWGVVHDKQTNVTTTKPKGGVSGREQSL